LASSPAFEDGEILAINNDFSNQDLMLTNHMNNTTPMNNMYDNNY